MSDALEFMENKMYLPGYMSVKSIAYQNNTLLFDFIPVEPQVTILSSIYMTPRGMHITISQATYAFVEELVKRGEFGLTQEQFREIYLGGRLKLRRLSFDFRKEIATSSKLQGRLDLIKMRAGQMPIIKMNYDLVERAVTGEIIGMLAPHSVPQKNCDILRINQSN